ncbi:F-box/FBD/LRR-repeat protein At1g13570-like isoform X1 [Rhododendron vialii]|uniref:F-box/FBD/LRR-repeat protein At1g13570-like isoform X1 n=1 Tax=Rhododendron vialii TaxID=182163 RepID=UPI00265D991D|nr:F-box/FBD/LRR-repeat protein At1g13570-like isoform X1 [Rhododendron vialii]XP_058193519.1 F-box/FBD/LRR-repeat protein At1g13570-like isoform X1 [Rhododendron vialii]XP_058193520.1 F-box/FBD/LRR-repeat protein At1g13570-like isoform X1 [Rhododendron vialii]XP_058193522.1 F-box/FBD/LRR-repeat protein At1g13570-like isoform X1 [Rhododendron vialii]
MLGKQRSTSDIISNLPSYIVENILKYLPLRDAVRTSVLSRRWRYKWVTLPQLVFDHNLFFLNSGDWEKIKAIIYRVLLLHQGPLVKFELSYPPFGSCMDIENWILMLLKKNIQKFTLRLDVNSHYEFPCQLFSFLQLKRLNLCYCVFKPPPTFKGFSRLVDLKLCSVSIAPKMFEQFISNCSLLEQLRLSYCTKFDFLIINAPNLKHFFFCGTLKSVSFKNTPLLAVVSIELFSLVGTVKRPEEEADSDWVKFFQCLPAAIEDMHLDRPFLESFAAGHIPESIPSTLNHLKVLALSYISTCVVDHVSHALCLLRSFPNLERVDISIHNDVPNEDPVVEYLQAQDFSKFSLNQLRKVKMWSVSGVECVTPFAKILLAHSPVLEKMVILLDLDNFDEKGAAMLEEELTRFQKASPKAHACPWMMSILWRQDIYYYEKGVAML